MKLSWHTYKYFPYELDLATREIDALLDCPVRLELSDGIELRGNFDAELARNLTYMAGYANGAGYCPTVQSRLEDSFQTARNRQATRYSVHGMHEYKGKFNPQVARSILNIFGVKEGCRVFDPFCGSGTTLVESAHIGATGVGTDINPLAVFVANAKLLALVTPFERLQKLSRRIAAKIGHARHSIASTSDDPRSTYLSLWFDEDILERIELTRRVIEEESGSLSPIYLVLASNLLRDYSQQDPIDLRIRRRKTPLPSIPLQEAFISACEQFVERLRLSQSILGTDLPLGTAVLANVNEISQRAIDGDFDAAITSPPYAMALPYIDTQRLSLVWLELLAPDQILPLEAELIGSREVRGAQKREMAELLLTNGGNLPNPEHHFCLELHGALGASDGFRRKAVPTLLYRYFSSMQKSFSSVRQLLKSDAKYALIVGHNHTVLGGVRRDINTPAHLASIAASVGWKVEELVPLQTYRRYGYHVSNAVAAETLIVLRK